MKRIIPVLFIVALMLTASVFVPIPPITQDYISQEGIAEADTPKMEFPTMSLAGEGDESADSILEFAETLTSDTGLDPDSDTNADAVYSEWDFSESVDPDMWYYPDPLGLQSTDGFVWGTGSTSGTHTDTHTDDTSYYSRTGMVGGPAWGVICVNVTPLPYGYTTYDVHINAVVRIYRTGGAGTVDSAGLWLFGFGIPPEGGPEIKNYDGITDTGYDSVDETVTVPASSFSGGAIRVGISLFDWDASTTWRIDLDYIHVEVVPQDGYTESFQDVSDWTFDSESAGLPSRSFTTDGDVLTFEIGYDDVGAEWAKYDAPISVSRGDFIEIRFICSVTAGAYMSTRLNLVLDAVTITSAHSATWITQRFLISDYCTVAPTEITLYIDDYANTHASNTGYVMFDYIRIGSVMGWGYDGSTTAPTVNDGDGDKTYITSTDGDILTLNCSGTATGTSSYNILYVEPTDTDSDMERDYYAWVEIRFRGTSTGNAIIDGTIRTDGYASSLFTHTTGTLDGEWHIVRKNHKEATTVKAENQFHIYAINNSMDAWSYEVEIDYIRMYGFNNWTYYASATNSKTSSVAYYDSTEDALAFTKTVDTSIDYVRLRTRNTTIGYAITDAVVGFTVKAGANTTARMQCSLTDGAATTYRYYHLYDDWQTVWMAVDIAEDYSSLDFFEFLAYDWTTTVPSSGSVTWYIKDNVTIRPSWYDASGESGIYGESFADVSEWLEPDEGTGVWEATESISSDGDVMTFAAEGDMTADRDMAYCLSPALASWEYVELRYKFSASFVGTAYIYIQDEDDTGDFHGRWTYVLVENTAWTTLKVHQDAGSTFDSYDGKAECIYLSIKAESGIDIDLNIDYFRIGPATEMGWQYDGSAISPSIFSGTDELSTDGDILHAVGDHSSYGYLTWYPFFAQVDYLMCEIRWKSPHNIELELYDEDAIHYDHFFSEGGEGWTISELNIAGKMTGGTYLSRFNIKDGTDNDQEFWIDYIKFYSIANFTVTQAVECTVNDVIYVDSDALVIDKSSANWIKFQHDPTLSVAVATYNVWNLTLSTESSGNYWNRYVGGGFESAVYWDTTRGDYTRTGDLTDFEMIVRYDETLSAIRFWEDLVEPVISTFTNTPFDPSMASAVTIESIASDGFSIYTVEATVVVEPSGSSIGTVTMPLDYTTQGGAGIYSYTFSAEALLEGRYTFELEVDDGANRVYEYLTFTVGVDTYACHVVILNNLYELIPFDTFEVYNNDTRIYHDIIQVTTGNTYNITVKNRFGDTVNSTTFDADFEMVVFVNTYSFKFMNWYNGFLRVNVTRGGMTYSEIIMPTEIIEFNLFEATYTFSVDFLNGTTKFSQEITVTNSTGYVITGDSISDVFGLLESTYAMTTQINITVEATNNYALTISIDLLNVNTTINEQLIQVLLNITNTNSTIYDQTVDLLAYMQNVNSTLFSQTAAFIVNVYNNQTTIYDQTVSLLSNLENVNSTIYSQTVWMLSNITNMNTTIYSQTVTLLNNIDNMNSTIYAQTVWMLTNISNVNSTIYAQTVTLLADISNMNSTIYSQTVWMLLNITNVNSTLYTQTVSVLTAISNMNSTIYAQTVWMLANITNVNSTLYAQTITLLADISNLDSDIIQQTIDILADIENVNSTIYSQTVWLLSNITNMNSTIYSQTVTLLNNIENMNSTIYAQTLSILTNITNVNSTIYAQTVQMLADISNVNSTIYAQTVQMLVDIENVNSTLYTQTVTLLANIANIDSDIIQQTIDILADISNVNSTLYAQTVTLLVDISNVNSTIYSQTVTLLANIANLDSDIVQQTIDILADISNVNTTLYTQTVTLLTDISNVNTTLFSQSLTILTRLENINSTIYAQGVDVLTQIYNMNSTLYEQTISMLLEVDEAEELAKSIKGIAKTIAGEVVDDQTPLSASDIFAMMILVVLIFVFIVIVVWGLRAVLRDKREARVATSAQNGEEIDVEDPVQYA